MGTSKRDAWDLIENTPAVTLSNSLTWGFRGPCVVEFMGFANKHTLQVAVTVEDGNGKTLLPAIVVDPNDLKVIPIPDSGLFFAGGVTWKCDTPDVVDAWISLRRVQ